MEMHQATSLELGHLAIGQSSLAAKLAFGKAELAGQVANDEGCGAVPQHARPGVPDDRTRIVIGIEVNGLTQRRIVSPVALMAAGFAWPVAKAAGHPGLRRRMAPGVRSGHPTNRTTSTVLTRRRPPG